MAQPGGKLLNAAGDAVGGEVVDDKDLRLGAGIAHGAGAVHFAVGARKGRDQDAGSGAFYGRDRSEIRVIRQCFDLSGGLLDVAAVHTFQFVLIPFQQCLRGQRFVPVTENAVVGDGTDQRAGQLFGSLQQESAVVIAEQLLQAHRILKPESETVAEGHLHDSLGDAAHARSIAGDRFSAAQQPCHGLKQPEQRFRLRQPVRTVFRRQTVNAVSCLLEFR